MSAVEDALAHALRRLVPCTETLRDIAGAKPGSESAAALIEALEALAAHDAQQAQQPAQPFSIIRGGTGYYPLSIVDKNGKDVVVFHSWQPDKEQLANDLCDLLNEKTAKQQTLAVDDAARQPGRITTSSPAGQTSGVAKAQFFNHAGMVIRETTGAAAQRDADAARAASDAHFAVAAQPPAPSAEPDPTNDDAEGMSP